MTLRKIIHIDMDAFFASVEQRDFPELKGKPIVVGGNGRRGVVAAASYEARKFGVRSAMPGYKAAQLCPELIFVKHRFEVYKEVSTQIHEIFRTYTDLIEPLSLDEAYLDVTENKKGISIATDIAKLIQLQIKEKTHLTASAGVSFNKFLAKVASGWKKPEGLTVITPKRAAAFIDALPIESFYGIGKVTAQKMRSMNIHKGIDLKQLTEDELIHVFGEKSGRYYFQIVRALDDREVVPYRVRKSIGAEETYSENLTDIEQMKIHIQTIAEDVANRCEKHKAAGRTITLKIKYQDFTQITRSRTMFHFVSDSSEIAQIACDLLVTPNLPEDEVRLLGITLHNLNLVEHDYKPVKRNNQLKLKL